jgi:hypothetical protein
MPGLKFVSRKNQGADFIKVGGALAFPFPAICRRCEPFHRPLHRLRLEHILQSQAAMEGPTRLTSRRDTLSVFAQTPRILLRNLIELVSDPL